MALERKHRRHPRGRQGGVSVPALCVSGMGRECRREIATLLKSGDHVIVSDKKYGGTSGPSSDKFPDARPFPLPQIAFSYVEPSKAADVESAMRRRRGSCSSRLPNQSGSHDGELSRTCVRRAARAAAHLHGVCF